MNRTDDPDRGPDGTVERGCDRCDWDAVEGDDAALVERCQDRLREAHPRLWLRT